MNTTDWPVVLICQTSNTLEMIDNLKGVAVFFLVSTTIVRFTTSFSLRLRRKLDLKSDSS